MVTEAVEPAQLRRGENRATAAGTLPSAGGHAGSATSAAVPTITADDRPMSEWYVVLPAEQAHRVCTGWHGGPFPPAASRGTLAGMGTLILIGAVIFAGYLVSLRLHPWRVCSTCKGQGRDTGAVFNYATRSCTSCGGNGRRARLGVLIFHPGRQNWGERAPGAASAKRSKNSGADSRTGRHPEVAAHLWPGHAVQEPRPGPGAGEP